MQVTFWMLVTATGNLRDPVDPTNYCVWRARRLAKRLSGPFLAFSHWQNALDGVVPNADTPPPHCDDLMNYSRCCSSRREKTGLTR